MATVVAKRQRKPRPRKRITYKEFSEVMEEYLMSSVATIQGPVVQGLMDPFGRPRDAKGRFLNNKNVERTPTIRQLWKFTDNWMEIASKALNPSYWRKPLKTEVDRLLSPEAYAQLYNGLQRYDALVERELYNISHRLGNQINTPAAELLNNISRTYDRLRHRAEIPPVGDKYAIRGMTRADVMSDLLAICKNFPTVWDREKKTLKIITDPMSVVSPTNKSLRYNFGRFFITLPYNRYEQPRVTAHTPRIDRGGHDCVHPHVQRNGTICFGDGANAAEKAIRTGRFFDIVEIIMSVLPQHGRGPFCQIRHWDGVCDERFNPKTGEAISRDAVLPTEGLVCHHCKGEVTALMNCIHAGCEHRDECSGCLDLCAAPGCNGRFCENHYWTCSACSGRFCEPATGSLSPHFRDYETCTACYEAAEAEENSDEDDEDDEPAYDEDDDNDEDELD